MVKRMKSVPLKNKPVSQDNKLKDYTVTAPHAVNENSASVTAGEEVELLRTWDT